MSHFSGLVILTPEYAKLHTMEDSLDQYYEGKDVEPYVVGDVSDFMKVGFMEYFNENKYDKPDIQKKFLDNVNSSTYSIERNGMTDEQYIYHLVHRVPELKDLYVKLFKENYPSLWDDFETLYKKYGEEWNDNTWMFNQETQKWVEFSTCNPDYKWDWYANGGRWGQSIQTKSGELVDECLLGEIDWTPFKPEDYCKRPKKNWAGEKYYPLKKKVKWHYNTDDVPFCLVIDGQWYERGEMHWFACVENEKTEAEWSEEFMKLIQNLPDNSEVYNVDFHI